MNSTSRTLLICALVVASLLLIAHAGIGAPFVGMGLVFDLFGLALGGAISLVAALFGALFGLLGAAIGALALIPLLIPALLVFSPVIAVVLLCILLVRTAKP